MDTLTSGLQPFDCLSDPAGVAQRWRRWKRAFEYYLLAKGTVEPARRKAILLHTAGIDAQDIFETLPEVEGDDDVFEKAMQALDNYFQPRTNVPYERHIFRQMHQQPTESTDQFVTRLRQQAELCDFGEQQDDNIRDQVIDKCKSAVLRKQLLEKREVTLAQALDIARAKEVAERQAAKMEADESSRKDVNVVDSTGNSGKSRHKINQSRSRTEQATSRKGKCFRCGKEGHYAKDSTCPARNETCRKCGKTGHFASQCQTKIRSRGYSHQSSKTQRRVNHIESSDNAKQVTVNDEYAFSIGDGNDHSGLVTICVGGILLTDVLIDSGATCNLVDKATWELLKSNGIKCQSQKNSSRIFAYGAKELKTLGKFQALVELDGSQTEAEFVVIDGIGKPILGKATATELNVLRVGKELEKVNSVTTEHMIEEHQVLFEGIGKLKGFQAKLHIDPDVKPVAQPVRRIPFGLRSKVEAELQRLQDQDIIEPVEGPTPWVSPVVVIPKGSGVRICIDMRRANEAVVRERHPIPPVDEVLQDLNQSTVFSKLDLTLGFHQVELEEASRAITTFVTHVGLFRYKRLMFGVNSAPEMYQHIIRQVLQDCPGAANIADDIIVHGKGKEEHNERLAKVFHKLIKAGLTLNREKCQFGMSHLEFMGHLLTDRGIGPTQARVEAVQNAREPTCVSEVRSFLGLVNFSAKFIPNLAIVAEPLRKLCRQNVKFEWKSEQKEAFAELKSRLAKAETLAYFDKSARTEVIADAGPVGLGAVLVQWQNGERRVVYYASRVLSDVERRYSQTEKEALALVWACERFHVYLGGIEFDLITDHKPLEVIYGKRSKPSARIERWVLRLQGYNFRVVYRSGQSNIADALSRLTQQQKDCKK